MSLEKILNKAELIIQIFEIINDPKIQEIKDRHTVKEPIIISDIFKELIKHLSLKQAIILRGLRRTGKTTLVEKLLEEVKSTNKNLDLTPPGFLC